MSPTLEGTCTVSKYAHSELITTIVYTHPQRGILNYWLPWFQSGTMKMIWALGERDPTSESSLSGADYHGSLRGTASRRLLDPPGPPPVLPDDAISVDFVQENVRTWWRHGVETLSALLVVYEGKQPIITWFPSQWASNAGIWWFLDVSQNNCVQQTLEWPVI